MAAAGIVTDEDVRVQVGSGRKAHVFRSHPGATFKRQTLRDGGEVYDIALCGARGRMVTADVAMDACASCTSHLA